MYQDIKNFIIKIFSGDLTQNQKIFTTISLAWIILIGYLTWWYRACHSTLFFFLYLEKKRLNYINGNKCG
jgi:hypothetical protein